MAKPQQELSLTAAEGCCPLPVAQVHRAGDGGSCSNPAVGHEELEESSQRNSFAHFCFGFICGCFLSALLDEFQAEGMSGNQREKAVTCCVMCQGAAVTHGSWQDSAVPLTFAVPTGPATLTPGCPSTPTAAQHQLHCSAHTNSWGPSPAAPQPQQWPGFAKGTLRGVVAEVSPLRAGQEVAGKLPGCGSCPSTVCSPRATGQLQILAVAQESEMPQDQGNIPSAAPIWITASAFRHEAMRFWLEFISQPQGSRAKVLLGSVWGWGWSLADKWPWTTHKNALKLTAPNVSSPPSTVV